MDEQTQTLDDRIASAVREGYTMKEIADHLASSDNPEHKAWAQKWTGAKAPEEPASTPTAPVNAPLTQFVSEHPVEAGLAAAGGLAALKAPGLYQAAQDRKVQNRKLDIEERRLGAYEEQVARQGMGNQATQFEQPAQEAPKLTPLEEARIETERARAEAIKQKIAYAEAKAAREEAATKAREEAAAAKAQKGSGGSITETEAKMMAASNLAGQTKEATAQQKKITGKAGNAVSPVEKAADVVANTTEVAKFNRDPSGKIQWPQGMTPAAQAGAEAFMTQFPELAKQLEAEGRLGILGAGSGDNNLKNSYGVDFAKTLRNEVNQGQMVGTYGNYKNVVNPAIGQIPPESAIGKQLEELRTKQPEGGTHGRLGVPAAVKEGKLITAKNALNPALKAGAPAALLMAISNAADAAQAAKEKDTQMTRGYATDLLGALTGPLGMIASQTFGTSPEDLRILRAAEQGRKVGGGRGIAPPSAYQK